MILHVLFALAVIIGLPIALTWALHHAAVRAHGRQP